MKVTLTFTNGTTHTAPGITNLDLMREPCGLRVYTENEYNERRCDQALDPKTLKSILVEVEPGDQA